MTRTLNTLLLTLCFIQPASAQTGPEIARKAFASTVLLVMEDSRGQPVSLGSGFFVGDGEIATNLHVVRGAVRGYAKIIGQSAKFDIENVIATDNRRDLAILKISGAKAAPLVFGDSETVQVGEPVYAVGNPQGLEGTFSQGIVSALRELDTNRLLQITAPISPGSSGGPVLNGKGHVIGVSVATYKEGQNLNFAIPAAALQVLMKGPRTPKKLTELKSRGTEKSAIPSIGQSSTEGVVCEQLTWEVLYSQSGGYAISVRNKLRENVKNVYCLLIFYDGTGSPIDVDAIRFSGVVPAGLARRTTSSVDGSVQRLTTPEGALKPRTRVESRTLNFEIEALNR